MSFALFLIVENTVKNGKTFYKNILNTFFEIKLLRKDPKLFGNKYLIIFILVPSIININSFKSHYFCRMIKN